MDHFGVGHAMQGMASTYFQASRQTGRTTSLVESLKDGDRVVVINGQHAKALQRRLDERRLKVECVVVEPAHPEYLTSYGTPAGRTIFDHVWVEERYRLALKRCADEVDYWQRELSGFGEAHLETRRRAQELSKWSAVPWPEPK